MISLDELATRANLDAPTTDTVLSFAASTSEEEIARDLAVLRAGRPIEERAPLWNLLLALRQIEEADARHAERGIERDVSDATWRDIGLWATTSRERMGFVGITSEILAWSQAYLRGNVIRVGAVQWDFVTSYASAWGLRHRETSEVRWAIAPGTWLSYGGRHRCAEGAPGARRAEGEVMGDVVRAHPIDVRRAAVDFGELVTFDRSVWETFVDPSSPMMEMHIPADAPLDMNQFVASARRAEKIFALRDARKPAGFFGDAWLLDPQVPEMLPNNFAVAAFQSMVSLLPGGIPEAKTIRRFFGADATRASIAALAPGKMSSLQRAIVAFLSNGDKMLCAACGVLSQADVEAIERALA